MLQPSQHDVAIATYGVQNTSNNWTETNKVNEEKEIVYFIDVNGVSVAKFKNLLRAVLFIENYGGTLRSYEVDRDKENLERLARFYEQNYEDFQQCKSDRENRRKETL
jgi:hypothetical protein